MKKIVALIGSVLVAAGVRAGTSNVVKKETNPADRISIGDTTVPASVKSTIQKSEGNAAKQISADQIKQMKESSFKDSKAAGAGNATFKEVKGASDIKGGSDVKGANAIKGSSTMKDFKGGSDVKGAGTEKYMKGGADVKGATPVKDIKMAQEIKGGAANVPVKNSGTPVKN